MSQMLKSSGAMGAATLTSRILGMVREIVYANFMGDSPVASAFKFAFQVPSLFRRLLGEGALSAAFIPIFKEKEKRDGEREMWHAANAVVSGLVVAAAAIIGLVLLGVSLALLVYRFDANTRLMLQLLRLMFPYMLLVCVAAVFMGMLNARGHFFVPAMSATMLNVVMIASVWWLAPRMGATLDTQIFGLAIGVLVAGGAQACFQWPLLRRDGYRYQWIPPWRDVVVRQVLLKMVPGMMGVAAFQLNVLLTNCIAFYIDKQIVASFDYAVRLMELPQGVFGISLATYLLPTLAGLAAEKKYAEFRSTLTQGLGYLLFVNLIASVLLTVLAKPIIRLLFERGQFDAASTQRASLALACLAPGLAAFSVVNILARAFYALGDTKTPMLISIVCLGLNLVFALWLIGPLRQAGMGVANTMSAVFNVYLLAHALRRKMPRLDWSVLRECLVKMVGAMGLAGGLAWLAFWWWDQRMGHARLAVKIGAVFGPMTLAVAIYWTLSLLMKIPAAQDMAGLLGSQPSKRKEGAKQE
jgi:putative peptidoglycan lipid II flippase